MTILKYFGEQGGSTTDHGGQLHWPGTHAGIPFRGGQVPNLKSEEETDQVQHVLDFHCHVFALWEEEDLKAYSAIRDRAANGWYHIAFIERQFDEDKQHWRVYLEWHQIYGELADGKQPMGAAASQ